MKVSTYTLRKEMVKDIYTLNRLNNPKVNTPELIKRNNRNKIDKYIKKWLKVSPKTKAQEQYVSIVIDTCFNVWNEMEKKK